MADFLEQFKLCLPGRVCLLGLGNVDSGDDGFGVRLAEALIRCGAPGPFARGELQALSSSLHCLIAGTQPERFVGRLAARGFDHLVFLDAVEFGGPPGSVVLLNSDQMQARFPQVSTHALSLGLLARWVEANGVAKAWLLGVEPASVQPGSPLSGPVQETLGRLLDVFRAECPLLC